MLSNSESGYGTTGTLNDKGKIWFVKAGSENSSHELHSYDALQSISHEQRSETGIAPEKKCTQGAAESQQGKSIEFEMALMGFDSFFDQRDNKKIVL